MHKTQILFSCIMFSLHMCAHESRYLGIQDDTPFVEPIKKGVQQPPKLEGFSDLFARANELFQSGKLDEAILYYGKTIDINPSCFQAHFNRGLAQTKKQNYAAAEQNYRKALEVHPEYEKAHLALAATLKSAEKFDDAITEYKNILQKSPYHFDAHMALGHLLCDLRRFDEAIFLFEKAMQLKPENTQGKFSLANAFTMKDEPAKALPLFLEIEQQIPQSANVLCNIAYTYKKMGWMEEALNYYRKTIAVDPNHAEGHFALGTSLITIEDFENGWREYEWRWQKKRPPFAPPHRAFWDGSDLSGQVILLQAEQGLGDTFQFIRLGKIAKERGALVIAAVQNPLVKILSNCTFIDRVISLKEPSPPSDVCASLMSLPHILGTTVETIPIEIPYLHADESLVEFWGKELADDHNFKIGICWQGNPNYSTPFLRNAVAAKSVNLRDLEPISQLPGVSLYCLQKTTGEEQIDQLPDSFSLHVFGPDFDRAHGAFMDTAAVMKHLDLVLTVDTSIAHLAGGLGVPVWVILPEPADWRWMLRESDSPWYPHMRLFRQPSYGDWDSVIRTVVRELKKEIWRKNYRKQQMKQKRKETAWS